MPNVMRQVASNEAPQRPDDKRLQFRQRGALQRQNSLYPRVVPATYGRVSVAPPGRREQLRSAGSTGSGGRASRRFYNGARQGSAAAPERYGRTFAAVIPAPARADRSCNTEKHPLRNRHCPRGAGRVFYPRTELFFRGSGRGR